MADISDTGTDTDIKLFKSDRARRVVIGSQRANSVPTDWRRYGRSNERQKPLHDT